MIRGECRGRADLARELFFGNYGGDAETLRQRETRESRAKTICGECAVRAECLDYALGHNIEHGIWGGKTENERRQLRRKEELNTNL